MEMNLKKQALCLLGASGMVWFKCLHGSRPVLMLPPCFAFLFLRPAPPPQCVHRNPCPLIQAVTCLLLQGPKEEMVTLRSSGLCSALLGYYGPSVNHPIYVVTPWRVKLRLSTPRAVVCACSRMERRVMQKALEACVGDLSSASFVIEPLTLYPIHPWLVCQSFATSGGVATLYSLACP